MQPWNDWYHVNGHTYGQWLRGDPRGWRARHHREHVEGDYKNPPPPGTYEALHKYSKSLMKRDPVTLAPPARRLACDTMAQTLVERGIDVVRVSVDRHHYHILARFRDHNPREWVGIAKSVSARALSKAGLVPEGGVWAVRCRCLPITDRAHQVNVARYIEQHARIGAAIWKLTRH